MTIEHQQLSQLIHRCGDVVGHYYGSGCTNPGQVRILRKLYENGSMSQKELLNQMGIKPGSLSEMLSKLESHQYISRKKDEHDKRIIVLSLTGTGKEYYLSVNQKHEQYVDEVLNSLDESEKEALQSSLEKILTQAKQYLEKEKEGK